MAARRATKKRTRSVRSGEGVECGPSTISSNVGINAQVRVRGAGKQTEKSRSTGQRRETELEEEDRTDRMSSVISPTVYGAPGVIELERYPSEHTEQTHEQERARNIRVARVWEASRTQHGLQGGRSAGEGGPTTGAHSADAGRECAARRRKRAHRDSCAGWAHPWWAGGDRGKEEEEERVHSRPSVGPCYIICTPSFPESLARSLRLPSPPPAALPLSSSQNVLQRAPSRSTPTLLTRSAGPPCPAPDSATEWAPFPFKRVGHSFLLSAPVNTQQ